MLIRKTAGKRYKKRIFLVTDAGCSVNQEDLEIISEQFLKIDARLNVMYATTCTLVNEAFCLHTRDSFGFVQWGWICRGAGLFSRKGRKGTPFLLSAL